MVIHIAFSRKIMYHYTMLNKNSKDKIQALFAQYSALSKGQERALEEIAAAEIPEMVYNSNAIENSTLTLEDTENILLRNQIKREVSLREVYEAKNLALITESLLENPNQQLTIKLILDLHKALLTNIDDDIAGRFRTGKEWVRVGAHLGANPAFVSGLMSELVNQYNDTKKKVYFLDKIAHFHAEFETIHPFCDGNGRMGRILINQQLMKLGYPPIIVHNKSKHRDYYPLFDIYSTKNRFDGFTKNFALLLMESLNKRITILSSGKIITLSLWAKQNEVRGNSAVNKAVRQTIPAFRMRQKWMIARDFKEDI